MNRDVLTCQLRTLNINMHIDMYIDIEDGCQPRASPRTPRLRRDRIFHMPRHHNPFPSMTMLLEDEKKCHEVVKGPGGSKDATKNKHGFQRPYPRTLGARLCQLQHHRGVLRLVQRDHRRRPRRPDAKMVIRMDGHRTVVRRTLAR